MLKNISILILTLSTLTAFADPNPTCTAWTKQASVSCIFAGEFANIYRRQCENPCWQGSHNRGNLGPDCDQESLCHFDNPETFDGPCSAWTKSSGVTCYDPNSQSWEQRWERACTNGLRQEWCSRDTPQN